MVLGPFQAPGALIACLVALCAGIGARVVAQLVAAATGHPVPPADDFLDLLAVSAFGVLVGTAGSVGPATQAAAGRINGQITALHRRLDAAGTPPAHSIDKHP